MFIHETYINATKGYQFGDSGWYEPYTDSAGKLFRSLQREYGRCTGWVFSKRMRYDDARGNNPDRDYYTHEVWVSVAKQVEFIPAKTIVTY